MTQISGRHTNHTSVMSDSRSDVRSGVISQASESVMSGNRSGIRVGQGRIRVGDVWLVMSAPSASSACVISGTITQWYYSL